MEAVEYQNPGRKKILLNIAFQEVALKFTYKLEMLAYSLNE